MLNTEDLVNWWLEKYHDTNIKKITKENPEWAKSPEKFTRVFYDKYKVTQKQHDEWNEWAIKTLMKEQKLPKKLVERNFGFVYLDTAPSIMSETEYRIKKFLRYNK